MAVERFIRFSDENGEVRYGELAKSTKAQDVQETEVEVLSGDPFSGFEKSNDKRRVQKLLCPLESTPIIMCIGLNYRHHATEAKLTIPKYPVVFTKPADTMTGPYDDVSITPDAQPMLDYEGELTVIIGKDGKDISADQALDYVLGYTVGNDVSARNFQLPDVSGGQFCYAKSFDKFAPIGPCITTSAVIKDPQTLKYTTKVNGKLRQETGTDDMVWTVRQIIEHLSRGTTLRKGTLIMTGTPSGVGLFMNPRTFLQDGDVVEIEIEGIGAISNKMVYETPRK